LSNGLKPKATELPRARYSCGLLEAARALAGWETTVIATATLLKSVRSTVRKIKYRFMLQLVSLQNTNERDIDHAG
jgi:hypothetical protein